MFKLVRPKSYSWPVELRTPTNGGSYEKATIDLEFRYVPQSEVTATLQALEGKTFSEVVEGLVVGWTGVADESGNDVPFSVTNLAKLLDIPGVAATIFGAWAESLSAAPAKN